MRRGVILLLIAGALVALYGSFLAKESGRCLISSAGEGVSPPSAGLPAIGSTGIKHIRANGIDFAYSEAGAGPLVLLLHGYPETPVVWQRTMQALARAGYHAVAPYMRGYPPSGAAPDGDYSIRALGKDLLALIEALGDERAILIGHDWGASAVYAAAYRSPQTVRKLIAVSVPHPIALQGDPSALWKASHFIEYQLPFMAWWLTTKEFCHIDAIYARWSPGWTPPEAVLNSVKASFRADEGFRNALGYYWSFFSSGAAGAGDLNAASVISVPVLVIAGKNDGGIDISRYENARQGFSGPYEFLAFEKSGHFPELEEPETFDEAVLRFLGPPQP